MNFLTAYLAYWKAGLTSDAMEPNRWADGHQRRVLIHAAAGGVGTAAVEIGKLLGIETYGTSSSDEKLERVKKLGLDHGINYREVDYEQRVKELTNGEGMDAVFEMLGGEHAAKSLRCCRSFGRVIIYGTATGQPHQLDAGVMMARSLSAHGLWLSVLAKDRELIDRTSSGHAALDRRRANCIPRLVIRCRWIRPARPIDCCSARQLRQDRAADCVAISYQSSQPQRALHRNDGVILSRRVRSRAVDRTQSRGRRACGTMSRSAARNRPIADG